MRSSTLGGLGCLGLYVLASCSSTGSVSSDAGTADAGSDAPAAVDAAVSDAAVEAGTPIVTKEEIQFTAKDALPAGESILANDWASPFDSVFAMRPDGTGATTVFQARRVWSFSAARDGSRIAFSSEDPKTEEHYGITTNDSIQNTWMFDLGTKAVALIGPGNVNDECHAFSPDAKILWVCRRYDFRVDNTFSGWRIGKFDLATNAFSFVTPEEERFALVPNMLPDGKTLVHGHIDVSSPTKPVYSIVKRTPESGPMVEVRAKAGKPSVSPDGTKYAFTDYGSAGRLALANIDGSGSVVELATKGGDPTWSPDGKRLAITVDDSANNCQHVDVLDIEPTPGSPPSAPTRILDCTKQKRFITNLAWIKVP